MPGTIQARDILNQLDESCRNLEFPAFENAYYLVSAMRLTAFRDTTEWLLIFEELCYGKHERRFLNKVSAYGNHMPDPGYQWATRIMTEVADQPMWDERQHFALDPWRFEVAVHGRPMSFAVTPADYHRAKIDPTGAMPPELRLLRLLTDLIPDQLFLTDERLLAACNRANIPKLLQLSAWHHPSVIAEEVASQFACFQNLAQAIAENDRDRYHCPEPMNTCWYCWEQDL